MNAETEIKIIIMKMDRIKSQCAMSILCMFCLLYPWHVYMFIVINIMVIATAIAFVIVIAIVIVYPSGIREINSQGP